ncbi:DUF2922 domain-containing protein [Enterococcus sp. DIV0170]|uniref:DUF2922 domain-containing protein n=1 Tax=Enterococcus sp. DIV0170 TaxID=2774642 RepID=UPI003F29DA97
MFTLDAEFENSDGKSQHLRIKHFDPTKTGEEIKASLTKLTKLNLFEKKGVGLFKKVKHATLIETIETEIFNNNTDVGVTRSSNINNKTEEAEQNVTASEGSVVESGNAGTSQDFVVWEERPEPGVLVQKIELPVEVNPLKITQEQVFALVVACMPNEYELENIQFDESERPVKLILTEKLKENLGDPAELPAVSLDPPKKERKRLLDRLRKRE